MNKFERWVANNPNKAAILTGVTGSVLLVTCSAVGPQCAHILMEKLNQRK